mgnify:CR=1 FL=1
MSILLDLEQRLYDVFLHHPSQTGETAILTDQFSFNALIREAVEHATEQGDAPPDEGGEPIEVTSGYGHGTFDGVPLIIVPGIKGMHVVKMEAINEASQHLSGGGWDAYPVTPIDFGDE